jgi:hypothetical protein
VNKFVLSVIFVAGVAGAAGCAHTRDGEAPVSSVSHDGAQVAPRDRGDSLGTYETKLSRTVEAPVSAEENQLLRSYLDAPMNPRHAEALARLHVKAASTTEAGSSRGDIVAHAILAQYFLHRLTDLGQEQPWATAAQRELGQKLEAVLHTSEPISLDEHRPVHLYWRAAFHQNQEQNRYQSLRGLLDDLAVAPNNVYTSFAIAANTLWVGGEADFADPTILNDFVIGGYFSIRTIALAKQVEAAWQADPEHNTRFRLAPILGGFSVLQRRWLAIVAGDTKAIGSLDQEHRKWLKIQPAFHGFTYGLTYFEDAEHFAEGLKAIDDSYAFCVGTPGVRTCSDLPRFKFNLLAFQLGYVDWLLKKGDVAAARHLLGFRHQTAIPTNYGVSNQVDLWKDWSIGRDAWLHREQHADEIAALYRENPAGAPANFFMKKKKWGTSTITCQECHETQARVQTPAEMDDVQLPPEVIATVGSWPEVSTTWYGAAK